LLETADVFLQGYRPGSMEKLGLSHSQLAAIGDKRGKPFIIVDEACYGGELEKGPWSARPGYQQIADSTTGVAWETGWACGKDEPLIPCLPISDYCTGILCAAVAVLGLVYRSSEPGGTGTIAAPVALSAYDFWIRNQEHYPDAWVRKTYEAGPQFGYQAGFREMFAQIWQHQMTIDPSYNQPRFYDTVSRSGFKGNEVVQGAPRTAEDLNGVPYTHVAPVIKFEGIDTRYTSTAPWGFYRPGWDEEDADVLEGKIGG